MSEILTDQTAGALPIVVPQSIGAFCGYGLRGGVSAVDDAGRTTESTSPGELGFTP